MVSVVGKGGESLRQVRLKEANVSKPLMTCRNSLRRRRNREYDLVPASKGWELKQMSAADLRIKERERAC